MPWRPRYTEAQARAAIHGAESWKQVLEALGYPYFGKNIQTVRKWAERWGIDVSHLPVGRNSKPPPYTPSEARRAIAGSRSWAEALRRLGCCHTGGNPKTLKKRAREWGISTAHFDPAAAPREALRRNSQPKPLSEVLTTNSTYSRSSLKRRLYAEGLKERRCEKCGQDETWNGANMSLILDHVNGDRTDNRIENLRIVCPNCAATLDTHCGRKNRVAAEPVSCDRCGTDFIRRYSGQRYCSRYCGTRWNRTGIAHPRGRKVERPSREQLLEEIREHGYLGVGRRYGVSDTAVRKWVRQYERERALSDGRDPEVVDIPRRTWPNMKKAA
jgi:hypothetical protein